MKSDRNVLRGIHELETHGHRYHGYIDNVLIIGFGIEDFKTAGIDVVASNILLDLGICSPSFSRDAPEMDARNDQVTKNKPSGNLCLAASGRSQKIPFWMHVYPTSACCFYYLGNSKPTIELSRPYGVLLRQRGYFQALKSFSDPKVGYSS
ncbi:hypothetical protein ACO22_02787 [Paracoccidioides brasiliensis]|uniref:Uncharacterized protein n=1 Tax=Paracoccidioides brasiliensis TaxID=121759 RepID=A0A1D2JHQ9_PARBR|nr:hypothetical protein ACO22_02787 [Paracoccidioides brasiliensis]